MGFDNDSVVNILSLPGEFFCAVCRTLVYPNKCIQGPCRHLYCEPCATHMISTTCTCPYDGKMVTVADCKPLLESNKTMADTIGKVQVHCLFHRSGCTWEGSLSDSTSHCLACPYGESGVLCSRCGIPLKHREGEEHSQVCSGVLSHAQQPGGVGASTYTGVVAGQEQTQIEIHIGGSVPQATSSQTAQMYQQLPYQHYPGYYPYQFYYPYYYGYPQVADIQAYPQSYGQAQTPYIAQPQVPSQAGQPPLQPQAYAAVNAEPVVPSLWQPQPQTQSQGHAQPQMQAQGQEMMQSATFNPSQPLSQASLPFPLQPLQVPLYPGALPKMQRPYMEPYPNSQPNPQSQSQSHLNMPASVHPRQSGAESQFYSQVQEGSGHTVQPLANYSSQMQGQYPPNQQQPAMSRGKSLSGPSVKLPAVYGQPPTAQPNVGQSYAGRPMDVQAVLDPNAQVASPAGAGQARPSQLNQCHPTKTHNPLSRTEQQTFQSKKITNNESMDIDITSNAGSRDNGKAKNGVAMSDSHRSRSKEMPVANTKIDNHVKEAKPSSKVDVREGNHAKEAKPSTKVGAGEGALKTPVQYVKRTANDTISSHRLRSKEMPDSKTKMDNHVKEAKPSSKFDAREGNHVKEAKPITKVGVGEGVLKTPVQYVKRTANDTTSSPASRSTLHRPYLQSQVHGTNSYPTMDCGSNPSTKVGAGEGVLKTPVQYVKRTANDTTSSSASRSTLHRPYLQSQVHGTNSYPTMDCGSNANQPIPYEQQTAMPGRTSHQLRPQVPVGSIPLHGSSGSQGQPGDLNYYQGPSHHSDQSQKPSDYPFVGPSATAHRPGTSRYEIEKFGVLRSGHYDGRQPDSHHHGPTEHDSRGPYLHGIQPEDVNYSGPSAHRPVSAPGMPNDFGKFPRPNFEAGPFPNFESRFSSSEPIDHGPRMVGGDRMLRPFDMGPRGRDPSIKMDGVGSGPSRLLPPFPPYNARLDDHVLENHDLVPNHSRRGRHMDLQSLHLGEEPLVGRPGENPGNFMQGEPGIWSDHGFSHHAHGGEFYPRDMNPSDNLRKEMPGVIMCRICNIQFETVEGLDLHSQLGEHQQKVRIKQNKKQKVSKSRVSGEEGRDGGWPKNSGFEGRGNKH